MTSSSTGIRKVLRDWWSLLLLAAILLPVSLRPPYKNSPPIRSDGFGYHLWTRAILEWDFRFCQWSPEIDPMMRFTHIDHARGICQIPNFPGLALLRFPVMAPLVDRTPGAPLIGAKEEQASLLLGAFALLVVAWCSLATTRLLAVPDWAAHASLLTFVFGTGLFHYATYDGSFTHVYTAMLFSILLWVWVRAQKRGGSLPWGALLPISFYLASMRITNLFLLAILSMAHAAWTRRWASWSKCWLELWPVCVGSGIALLLQLTYNYYALQRLQLSSYGEQGFHFDRPMQVAVLFSYERGLFTYYPVVAVCLAAGLWPRRTRDSTRLALLLIGVFSGIYGFWVSWTLGAGFGHRGFVDLVPLFILIFAVALPELPAKARKAVLALAMLSTAATLELMLGYWNGSLPFEHTTRRTYWANILDARWLR